MALTVPSVADFRAFWGSEADDIDDARASELLDLATNLLWIAVDLDDDPDDPRLFSLVQLAIMDMAIYLFATRDDLEAAYSPFQSEHIGSYSYAKSWHAQATNIANGTITGVPIFDKVVEYFVNQAMYDGGFISSENVFHHGYVSLREASILTEIRNYSLFDPVDRFVWYARLGIN